MDLHQIVSGALNSGESPFAVGSIEGINFTVCAVGCDLVILAPDFQRVQIIPGTLEGNVQVSCVDCCSETGKIAAVYQNLVRLFDPAPLLHRVSLHKLDYRWTESTNFTVASPISIISWNLQGLRLLIAAENDLHMWQHAWLTENYYCQAAKANVKFHIETADAIACDIPQSWSCVWSVQLVAPTKCAKFSPDGSLFATVSVDDSLIKIWYEERTIQDNGVGGPSFSFIYLSHPYPVTGFEWRKCGRYMPNGCVNNAIISWCRDHVCRIWSETCTSDAAVDYSTIAERETHFADAVHAKRHSRLKNARKRITHRLKHLKHMKHGYRKSGAQNSKVAAALSAVDSAGHFCEESELPTSFHFHLAASISAASDCLLVPSVDCYSDNVTFGVHWLNNKELLFSLEAEKLLAEALMSSSMDASPSPREPSISSFSMINTDEVGAAPEVQAANASILSNSTAGLNDSGFSRDGSQSDVFFNATLGTMGAMIAVMPSAVPLPTTVGASNSFVCGAADQASPAASKDVLDLKMEALLRQWYKSSDVLFCIHPVDGSLLIWIMEWLDDFSRQPVISFSSRLPHAFPLTDAVSLQQNMAIFNPHDPIYVQVLQKTDFVPMSPLSPPLVNRNLLHESNLTSVASTLKGSLSSDRLKPPVLSSSSFADVKLARPRSFSRSPRRNRSRVFSENTAVAPLRLSFRPDSKRLPDQPRNVVFLLTSHDNGSLNLWSLTVDEKSNFSTVLNLTHVSRMCGHRFRINHIVCHPVLPLLLTTSHNDIKRKKDVSKSLARRSISDIHYFNSELILWKVDPVGPLCKSGGVRELARINSEEYSAFSSVAWIPVILPSSTLGTISNSPSSCFVASDGLGLRVYQAVIDARSLLAEVNYARAHKAQTSRSSDSPTSNSAASTPLHSGNMEELFRIVSTQSSGRPGCILELDSVANATKDWRDIQFLHVYPQQMIVGDQQLPESNRQPDLGLNSDAAVKDFTKANSFFETFFLVVVEKNREKNASCVHTWKLEIASQPFTANEIGLVAEIEPFANSKVYLSTKKVGFEFLPVSTETRVFQVCPAAGHLSSSSIYPACRAPYLFSTSGSDDRIRFWRCVISSHNGAIAYNWTEWNMIGDVGESCVEIDGQCLAVSSAFSGRFACIYDSSRTANLRNADSINVQVAVYECESSGGTEWSQEDVIRLRNVKVGLREPSEAVDLDVDRHSPVEELILDFSHRGADSLITRIPSIPSVGHYQTTQSKDRMDTVFNANGRRKRLVCLDWVSTEDGSHILTVGVGSKILLYAPVADDVAQQNLTLMQETETHKRPPLRKTSSIAAYQTAKKTVHWINLRTLVVGMESEMRVYSQWNRPSNVSNCPILQVEDADNAASSKSGANGSKHREGIPKPATTPLLSAQPVHLFISPSHSVLDLTKKAKDVGVSSSLRIGLGRKAAEKEKSGAALATGTSSYAAVIDIVRDEGLFEAARITSPMLPQYHPKQLIELLNAGRIRRVKAILLHVLTTVRKNTNASSTLQRQNTIARKGASVVDKDTDGLRPRSFSRGRIEALVPSEDVNPDYTEIDHIPPLPLHMLIAADTDVTGERRASLDGNAKQYDGLFDGTVAIGVVPPLEDELPTIEGLESDLEDDEDANGSEEALGSRKAAAKLKRSGSSVSDQFSLTSFTPRHSRLLTNVLTHVHLPGLSSTDQMHLLAVADTISSFSQDLFDKLASANAAFTKKAAVSFLEGGVGAGYAAPGTGAVESVDECGLRYLIALKQYEYLLRCLPMKQRMQLKSKGLSSSCIIWALHSETENELLNSIPCVQRGNATWEEMRAVGIGWWLKNVNTLRQCFEKMAKSAFQAKSDPMDAALYYMAMKKKNILCGLFKTVRDTKMADFFAQDFTNDKWKRGALKNAFVLIGKQRFEHAVAFFLLGGALDDALQVCLTKLNDLQLAIVIVRLYEADADRQFVLLRQLLCQKVLGILDPSVSSANALQAEASHQNGVETASRRSSVDSTASMTQTVCSADAFIRSMAFWHLKEYSKALQTLLVESLDEVADGLDHSQQPANLSISDIFNFYVFLRRHPLVVRQRITDAGVTVASTEAFLQAAKRLENEILPTERKLYFKAACTHFKSGCALLALEVLCKLPKGLTLTREASIANGRFEQTAVVAASEATVAKAVEKAADFDWTSNGGIDSLKAKHCEQKLELTWSDEEDDEETEAGSAEKTTTAKNVRAEATPVRQSSQAPPTENEIGGTSQRVDIMAQQMKFIACLKILIDELATLASGFEVEGGQLRLQLYNWLENEVEVLKQLCDYSAGIDDRDFGFNYDSGDLEKPTAFLHEALKTDRAVMTAKLDRTIRRRRWLATHQSLLRTLIAYCSLHSGQGVGIASVRMELLLLLQEFIKLHLVKRSITEELHQDPIPYRQLTAPLPLTATFPLLAASVASFKTDIADPIRWLQAQSTDILQSIAELGQPPSAEQSLEKVYLYYNLAQSLSSCIYESLCNIESFGTSKIPKDLCSLGFLLRRRGSSTASYVDADGIMVTSAPSKWPGVQNLVALLSRERDEDSPNLLMLLVEAWVAIYMALVSYAFAAYDARWLFRLAAHSCLRDMFAKVFGGCGERRLSVAVVKDVPPTRPPPPVDIAARLQTNQTVGSAPESTILSETNPFRNIVSGNPVDKLAAAMDPSKLRANLINKVFGPPRFPGPQDGVVANSSPQLVTTKEQWVPPKSSIIAHFMSKPAVSDDFQQALDYDSDNPGNSEEESESEEDSDFDLNRSLKEPAKKRLQPAEKQHLNARSYAWGILRLAFVKHAVKKLKDFLVTCGLEIIDLPSCSTAVHNCFRLLDAWQQKLIDELNSFGGCPKDFLPEHCFQLNQSSTGPAIQKYRAILESTNTPFSNEKSALPVKRLWLFLVRQEHLTDIFIKFIFCASNKQDQETSSALGARSLAQGIGTDVVLPEPLKIIQRDQDPITSFAINHASPGWIVVSTSREMQEMDISSILNADLDWINDPAALDVAMLNYRKAPLKDNDDYLLVQSPAISKNDQTDKREQVGLSTRGTNFLTPFVVDRSRVLLKKLCKRQVGGVKRLEAHPYLPYYLSGSTDGAVRLWEWCANQPLFTPRAPGQFSKVTRVRFSPYGNKFGMTDADGFLSLWQISHGSTLKKPYLTMRCHNKTASDFIFLSYSSSQLLTCGHSSGDQNLCLWDTLMPRDKGLVCGVSCHPEGAQCLQYIPHQQSVYSGGRHGDLCVFDLRQMKLRQSTKLFDHGALKSLALDPNGEIFVAGSSEGDIKIWNVGSSQQVYALHGEHSNKGTFTLRGVSTSSSQGVSQLLITNQHKLFSCGADGSLKLRDLSALF